MRFIAHWRLWWRRWSTWLAGLFAAATAAIVAYPSLLLGLMSFFPDDYRGFFAGAVFVIVFAVPVLVGQLSQKKLVQKKAELDAKN